MIIDLTLVFADEGRVIPVEYELSLAEVDFGGRQPLRQPVKISVRAENRTGIVTLAGSAAGVFEAPCDRCAAEWSSPFEIPIFHTVVREIHNEETEDMVLVPHGKLDADELFRCDVLLGLPVKHLCSAECRGICAGCGKNLNTGQCACKKAVDPRLQALADLLED